jgi:hypothetical protein
MSLDLIDYIETYDHIGATRHTVPRNSYIIVEGSTASICPNADPAPSLPLVDVENYYRREGRLKAGQTIHWVGATGFVKNCCQCFRRTFLPNPSLKINGDAATLIQELIQRVERYKEHEINRPYRPPINSP